jgi:hypothetical protein
MAEGQRLMCSTNGIVPGCSARRYGPIWRSLVLGRRQRPRIVVSCGSGIVVPFCMLARPTGASLVFVETDAQVSTCLEFWASAVSHRARCDR